MNIRKATLEDITPLASLFDAYRIFYEKESDVQAAIAFLSERIKNDESVIFVAENNNQLVGFVQLYPIFSSTRLKRNWLLNDLFVDPQYRGQGVSVSLIEAAKELCRATKSCGMQLETAKSNVVGNNLYQKTGFTLDLEHNYYFWEV